MLTAALCLIGIQAAPTEEQLLSARVHNGEASIGIPLTWNPDGRWAFYTIHEQSKHEYGEGVASLCAYSAQTAEVKRLYTGKMSYSDTDLSSTDDYLSGRNYRPHFIRWSPDGSRIMFFALYFIGASINADGNPLLDVDPATGKTRVLSKGWRTHDGKPLDMMMYDNTIAFSPDGRTLLLVIGAGRFFFEEKRIAAMAYPHGQRKWLTNVASASRSPVWSPDGSMIAFVSNPETDHEGMNLAYTAKLSRSRLFIMHANGSQLRQITYDTGFRDDAPRWANSKTLLFTRISNSSLEGGIDWDGAYSEWEVRTDGGGLRWLRDLPPED